MHATAHAPRQDYLRITPSLFRKYLDFSIAIPLDHTLRVLVDIRASQLNGCAFCLDMHVKQGKLHGERELRLHHVAIWRESPLFSARERAALAWTEALTRLDTAGVSDALYAEASEHLLPDELNALTYQVMAINGWNRINIAFRQTPGSQDKAFGLDKADMA